jgi:phosphatidylinositol-3-phosphatase
MATMGGHRRAVLLLAALGAAAAVSVGFAASSSQPATTMCGSMTTTPATYQHVVWIWMENKSYSKVIGAPGSSAASAAPYLNGTLVPSCGLATNFHNVSHPSLPNYLAATSGSTHGVASDCSPSSCPQSGSSIFSQLQTAKLTWRAYNESMPSNCSKSSSSLYAPKHNPAVYYTALASTCAADDIPLGSASSGAFTTALAKNTLPSFSFITPNLCNDTHDCSITTGDNWLKAWVPKIVASPAYQSGNTALFITWDEGSGGSSGEACATNTSDQSCHVATVVMTPYTPAGRKSSSLFNHYSLMKTTEQMLGLSTSIGAAASSTASMRSAFHM